MSKKAVYKNVRRKSFTQVSNDMLWNSNLTLQAKGLLSIFLSNSDEWDLNMKEIIKRSKNGRDAHYGVVNELIKKGYFARLELLNKKNQFEKMIYLFSDSESDIKDELENIEKEIQNEDKSVLIEYKDRNDKSKPQNKKSTEGKENEKTPLTENQDTDIKTPLTDNQYTGIEHAVNQYINNTKGNNTNLNNTKSFSLKEKEEEEENTNTRAREKTFAYQMLKDFLLTKNIDEETANKVNDELHNRNILFFEMKNVKKQYEHMMEKLQFKEVDNHNNFALYFVNGLEMRCTQSNASYKYQLEKEKEYEEMIQRKNERDTSIYYNWLEDAE